MKIALNTVRQIPLSKFRRKIADASRLPPPPAGVNFDPRCLTGDEFVLCQAIADRWVAQAKDLNARSPHQAPIEAHREVVAMDVAVTHVRRGLRLRDLLTADILSFSVEMATISTKIDRPLANFAGDVMLRFAQSGAIRT